MSQAVRDLPHGTTIVAATCDHGVVMAGDRRAPDDSNDPAHPFGTAPFLPVPL